MNGQNIVDSSGWLEYFAGTERMELFAPAIENVDSLIVPVITIYEVVKKFKRERGEADAFRAAEAMRLGRMIDVDLSLVLDAVNHLLPLADSLIYATALRHNAILWTQDEHFSGMPSVRYFTKLSARDRRPVLAQAPPATLPISMESDELSAPCVTAVNTLKELKFFFRACQQKEPKFRNKTFDLHLHPHQHLLRLSRLYRHRTGDLPPGFGVDLVAVGAQLFQACLILLGQHLVW